MKECVNCKNAFEPKRPHGKFCSDKCRVAYNRSNPSQVVTKMQVQVLYNEMLDLIKKAKSEPQQPYFSIETKNGTTWGKAQEPVKITLKRPFVTLQALMTECESQEEYEVLRYEIENADHLTRREKDILLRKR